MAAHRARMFAQSNPGALPLETLEQVADDVRRLATLYPQRPVSEILGDLVDTQDAIFTLLEQRQRPTHSRDLYMLAGVVGGMLAKASHDLADPHAAMTQARTAFVCAESAGHDGLRAWLRGLQAMFAYWAGRPAESVRLAQDGARYAELARSTTAVWLPISEARAWAALGNSAETHNAIRRAEDGWAANSPDDLDAIGGICSFSRPRQVYYAADALAWLPDEVPELAAYAHQAVEGYADPDAPDWAFGDHAGSQASLAIAQIRLGEIDGAAEALESVLALPVSRRINGVVHSVQRVVNALPRSSVGDSREVSEIRENIEVFTRTTAAALQR